MRAIAPLMLAAAIAVPDPPPREAVRPVVVPAPALAHVQNPAFTSDGERILAAARSRALGGTQIVSLDERGEDLRCLTCASWTGAELTKPFAFGDGRRVLVRVGRQTPILPADHAVVECTPSVRRCDSASVVPVAVPHGDERTVAQDQREMRIAPDGRTVAFTQVRRSPAGQSEGLGVVGRLVREPDRYVIADPRVVSERGELKGWSPDGQSVLVADFNSPFEAANPDDLGVDLRTGRRTRLTTDPDWEEDVDLAPRPWRGRRWMVVGSARTAELLEPVSQVRRPPYIDAGLRALPYAVFAANPAAIAEPWLVDAHDSRGGYRGQPLAPRGWDSRTNFRFHPSGDRVIFWQRRGGATRIVVAHLDDRPGQAPLPPRTSPAPRWAPALRGFRVSEPDAGPRRFARRGRVSGRVTVTRGRARADRLIEVRYHRFADMRGHVLDGFERSRYRRGTAYGGPARYTADLRLSGARTGFLRARDVRIGVRRIRGTIRSRVGGRRLTLGSRAR